MATIYNIEVYRRYPMPRRSSTAVERESQKGRKPKTTYRVQMSKPAFEAWGMWCDLMGLTREDSIVYLIERHPVDPKKVTEQMARLVAESRASKSKD